MGEMSVWILASGSRSSGAEAIGESRPADFRATHLTQKGKMPGMTRADLITALREPVVIRKSGDVVAVAASYIPHFKSGKELRERVEQSKRLLLIQCSSSEK